MSNTIFHRTGADFAEIGSNQVQAAVMEFAAGAFGARIGRSTKGRDYFLPIHWGNIPARPFLGLSDEDRVNVIAIVEDRLANAADAQAWPALRLGSGSEYGPDLAPPHTVVGVLTALLPRWLRHDQTPCRPSFH